MSRELDTIARRSAESLKSAVDAARLNYPSVSVTAPVAPRPGIRLVLVTVALLLVSAVGVALVSEREPESTPVTIPPATTIPTSVPLFEPPTPLAPMIMPVPSTTLPPATTMPADTTPPLLEITSPDHGAEVRERKLTITGTSEPGASVASGEHGADVDDDGNWSLTLNLSKGANHVEFSARDAAGNEAQAAITVHYILAEPKATTTTTTVKEVGEFVASATFGVCSLTPPYDVYYGKGVPSSTVYVQSEHGSGSTVVGEDGVWEVQVFFPEAPVGEAFQVKVYDDLGREKILEFLYQPEG